MTQSQRKAPTKREPPPASWLQRLEAAIAGARAVELDCLVDSERAAQAWFAAELEPEQAGQLDAIDVELARWLAVLSRVTRCTYQQNLRSLATALGCKGPRPVRTLIEAAATRPQALDTRLHRFAQITEWKAGTLRSRLVVLHQASLVLVAAGIAVRPVATRRPKGTDVDVHIADPRSIEAIDDALRKEDGPIAARTRAILQLAWSAALAPKAILTLQHEDVHLARRCLVIDGELIPLGPDAVDALRDWLRHRGRTDGPLLIAFDGKSRRRTAKGIGGRELQRSIANAARAAEVDVTLSGVRAAALLRVAAVGGRAVAHARSRNSSGDVINRLFRARRT